MDGNSLGISDFPCEIVVGVAEAIVGELFPGAWLIASDLHIGRSSLKSVGGIEGYLAQANEHGGKRKSIFGERQGGGVSSFISSRGVRRLCRVARQTAADRLVIN